MHITVNGRTHDLRLEAGTDGGVVLCCFNAIDGSRVGGGDILHINADGTLTRSVRVADYIGFRVEPRYPYKVVMTNPDDDLDNEEE